MRGLNRVGRNGGAVAVNLGITTGGREEAQNHPQRRSFSRAVFAQQTINLAPLDAERNAIDRQHIVPAVLKPLRQLNRRDHARAFSEFERRSQTPQPTLPHVRRAVNSLESAGSLACASGLCVFYGFTTRSTSVATPVGPRALVAEMRSL